MAAGGPRQLPSTATGPGRRRTFGSAGGLRHPRLCRRHWMPWRVSRASATAGWVSGTWLAAVAGGYCQGRPSTDDEPWPSRRGASRKPVSVATCCWKWRPRAMDFLWKLLAGVLAIDWGGLRLRGTGEFGLMRATVLAKGKPQNCASSRQHLIWPSGGRLCAPYSRSGALCACGRQLLLRTGARPSRQRVGWPPAWDHGGSGGACQLPAPSQIRGLGLARLTV